MSEKEKEILETFGKVIPELTEQDKERLLWFGEGLAFKVDQPKAGGTDDQPPPKGPGVNRPA